MFMHACVGVLACLQVVSCTSIRPKARIQVTGRCKGGGSESPPTNKLRRPLPGSPANFPVKPFFSPHGDIEPSKLFPVGFNYKLHTAKIKSVPLTSEESLIWQRQ